MNRSASLKATTLPVTLTTLISVVLLVAIGHASTIAIRARTREATCKAHLRQLGAALQMYTDAWNELPQTLNPLYPRYISDTRLFHCPNERHYARAAKDLAWIASTFTTYGYLPDAARRLNAVPPEERHPKLPPEVYISWAEAYAVRGEAVPLIMCQFHDPHLLSRHLDRPYIRIILRMNGRISKEVIPVAPSARGPKNWHQF